MTIRETAREAATEEVSEYAAREHRQNYHRLNIFRDGSVEWRENHSRNTQLVDDSASGQALVSTYQIHPRSTTGTNVTFTTQSLQRPSPADS